MSEWYGTLPEWWKTARIGSVFYENTASNGNLTSTTPMQFRFGEIVRKRETDKDEAFLNSIKRYVVVEPNDIMVNGLNLNYDFITQRVAIVHERGCMTPAYISLHPLHTVNPKYACYLLKAADGQKVLNGLGTGIRLTLSFSEFKRARIPLPPRAEQDQIVRYLDWKVSQVNRLINAKKKQIGLLQEQKRVEIQLTFNDVKATSIPCRHIGSFQNGISEAGSFFVDGDYPFVNYGDVYKNEILPQTFSGTAKSNLKQQETYSVREGDIFFTRTSETLDEVGLTSVCQATIDHAVFSGFLIRMRPRAGVLDTSYSRYFFRSKFVRDYFTKEMNSVIRASLGQNLLKNLPVILPSLEEQREVAELLEARCSKYDSLITAIQTEIALFQEYRTRLVSDVVTGKLDVRGVAVPEFEAVEEAATDDDTQDEEEPTDTEDE